MSTLSAISWLRATASSKPGNAAYISSGLRRKNWFPSIRMRFVSVRKLAGVDAQQHVLGFGVLAVDVVGVARGHQRQAHPLGDVDRAFQRQPLDFEAVVLDLDEVAVAETSAETRRRSSSASFQLGSAADAAATVTRLNSPETQPLRQMSPSLCAASSSLSMRGLKIEAFEKGGRGQLDQVLKARAVLGQQRQMVAGLLIGVGFFLKAAAGGDVGLVADDRIDARRPWPLRRTRAPRTDCRDRSGPGRSCPALLAFVDQPSIGLAPSSRL